MGSPTTLRIHARMPFFQLGMALLKAAILAGQHWLAATSKHNAQTLFVQQQW